MPGEPHFPGGGQPPGARIGSEDLPIHPLRSFSRGARRICGERASLPDRRHPAILLDDRSPAFSGSDGIRGSFRPPVEGRFCPREFSFPAFPHLAGKAPPRYIARRAPGGHGPVPPPKGGGVRNRSTSMGVHGSCGRLFILYHQAIVNLQKSALQFFMGSMCSHVLFCY